MSDLVSFHEQVKRGNLEGVRDALVENPALLNETNQAGQSGFLLAKYYRQEPVAEYLLSLNPTLDLFNSCVAGRTSAVLAEMGREPALLEAHSSDGWTPLHLAAFFGHPDLAAKLLDLGAEIESRSKNAMRNTPLHAAVAGGQVALVRLLLDRGADVNARQEGGWTPLHGAAQAGNREIVEVLMAHGADVSARAQNNQSPLDMALSNGRQDVASLLEQLGAKLQ